MLKAKFIKEFKLSRRMQRIITKQLGETEAEYQYRIKIAKYGLEGEDRVNYQLENIYLPIICLSNVRIKEEFGSAQADFIVISKNKVFIIEVKNLFGSVRVNNEGDVIRMIPRRYHVEEEGMANPFTQTHKQAIVFKQFLNKHGYHISIDILVVMGNPRTSILQGKNKYPIIRYDQLSNYFEKQLSKECNKDEYNKMIELGHLLKENNKEILFNNYNVMHKRFVKHNRQLPNLSKEDLILYEEILECRRKIAKFKQIPICNVFLNRDAESLVLYKPTTKEEFVMVPGFKEKKYLLCGQEIIEIIKKHNKSK